MGYQADVDANELIDACAINLMWILTKRPDAADATLQSNIDANSAADAAAITALQTLMQLFKQM